MIDEIPGLDWTNEVHYIPTDKKHAPDHEESLECWCRPMPAKGMPNVIVHFRLDEVGLKTRRDTRERISADAKARSRQ